MNHTHDKSHPSDQGELPEPFCELTGPCSQQATSPLGTGHDAPCAARPRLPFSAIERRIDAVEAANRLRASATDLLGKLSHFPDDADTNDIAVRCVEAIAAVALWRSATHKKENGNG